MDFVVSSHLEEHVHVNSPGRGVDHRLVVSTAGAELPYFRQLAPNEAALERFNKQEAQEPQHIINITLTAS